ncbi:hypothetical protein EBR78_10170 [bacterium]|nr:hypothetical protein [bacterium]NBX82627.1 hypothetical protein [bacterium]
MRQGVRFFVKPNAFINQLQWSSHHTWLLLAFLLVAGVEAHVGRNHHLVSAFAKALSFRLGLGQEISMWLMISLKLTATLIGAFLISVAVWFVGSCLGRSSSQRVLFRRLSVVFTLVFGAYTASHLTHIYPWMETASLFVFFWAALLGFFTLKEQFRLGLVQTAFVGGFTALLVLSSWHYSNRFLENNAQRISQQIAYKQIPFLPLSKKR